LYFSNCTEFIAAFPRVFSQEFKLLFDELRRHFGRADYPAKKEGARGFMWSYSTQMLLTSRTFTARISSINGENYHFVATSGINFIAVVGHKTLDVLAYWLNIYCLFIVLWRAGKLKI
jgi:hypothetical protein